MLPLWYLIIGAVISTITVIGNGTVVYLIATRRRLHNPANWIVLSLALADLSIGSGHVLTQYLFEVFSFEYNIRYAILSFLSAASAFNLCILTLDRHIFITKPLRYITLMNTRRAIFLILTAWMTSFLPHLSFYLICSIATSSTNLDNCTRKFKIFDVIVMQLLPMVILSSATGHIFYIVRKKSRQTQIQMAQLRYNHGTQYNRKVSAKNQSQNPSVKIIGVAVTVFIVCYLNDLCLKILHQLKEKKDPDIVYWRISELLFLVNSAINPVAYALFKSDIKKSLKSMQICRNRLTPD